MHLLQSVHERAQARSKAGPPAFAQAGKVARKRPARTEKAE
jgi:hypothetical protein